MKKAFIAVGTVLCFITGPGMAAAPATAPSPGQLGRLIACRSMVDSVRRLECFDRELALVQASIARKDLLVVDRAQAQVARRSLFGFGSAGIGNLFGDRGGDEIKEIVGVINSVRRNAEGTWTIRLGDGSTWTQTDDAEVALTPASGAKVVVRRGALGNYKLSVNGQPGVKVRRIG